MASSVFLNPGNLSSAGSITAGTSIVAATTVTGGTGFIIGADAGIDASVTTGALIGKTLTVVKGIVTGFA